MSTTVRRRKPKFAGGGTYAGASLNGPGGSTITGTPNSAGGGGAGGLVGNPSAGGGGASSTPAPSTPTPSAPSATNPNIGAPLQAPSTGGYIPPTPSATPWAPTQPVSNGFYASAQGLPSATKKQGQYSAGPESNQAGAWGNAATNGVQGNPVGNYGSSPPPPSVGSYQQPGTAGNYGAYHVQTTAPAPTPTPMGIPALTGYASGGPVNFRRGGHMGGGAEADPNTYKPEGYISDVGLPERNPNFHDPYLDPTHKWQNSPVSQEFGQPPIDPNAPDGGGNNGSGSGGPPQQSQQKQPQQQQPHQQRQDQQAAQQRSRDNDLMKQLQQGAQQRGMTQDNSTAQNSNPDSSTSSSSTPDDSAFGGTPTDAFGSTSGQAIPDAADAAGGGGADAASAIGAAVAGAAAGGLAKGGPVVNPVEKPYREKWREKNHKGNFAAGGAVDRASLFEEKPGQANGDTNDTPGDPSALPWWEVDQGGADDPEWGPSPEHGGGSEIQAAAGGAIPDGSGEVRQPKQDPRAGVKRTVSATRQKFGLNDQVFAQMAQKLGGGHYFDKGGTVGDDDPLWKEIEQGEDTVDKPIEVNDGAFAGGGRVSGFDGGGTIPAKPAGPGGDQPNPNPFPTKTPKIPFGKRTAEAAIPDDDGEA